MILNTEKTLATLNIKGILSASGMDELISQLAVVRAQMTPTVAASRPNPKDPIGATTPVTMEDSPAMIAAKLKDGRIRFWARSAGFGWLAFNVAEIDALLMRDYLIANLPERTSNLVGDSDIQRH